ncbi:MAG: hypothetical protein AAGF49_13970, partial [Pseudomonadota bacterium]
GLTMAIYVDTARLLPGLSDADASLQIGAEIKSEGLATGGPAPTEAPEATTAPASEDDTAPAEAPATQ